MTGSTRAVPGPAAAIDPASGRLPDFFLVGHPKCGTTALYEMLRVHPQVFMSELKEPRFFAPDLRARFLRGAPQQGAGVAIPRTLEQYLALFEGARADQIVGEASPSYLVSREAARRIAAARPDARIVAILREPVAFLRSLQLELLQNHVERERSFRRAIERELVRVPARAAGEDILVVRRYSDRIRYVEQLRRFHEAFAREQVLVLIYDDFARDNEATLRRVLRFLAVDEELAPAPRRANPTVQVRSLWADRAVRALYAGQSPAALKARGAIKALTPRRFHGSGLQALRARLLYGAPKQPPQAFVRELRLRFRPEVVAVSEYLKRDLVAEWGYDELD